MEIEIVSSSFGPVSTPSGTALTLVDVYGDRAKMFFPTDEFGELDWILLAESIGLSVKSEKVMGDLFGDILVCRDSNGSYRGCRFGKYSSIWRELKGKDKSIFIGDGCVKSLEFYDLFFTGLISHEDYLESTRGVIVKCKFNDCGWCYCKSGKSNDNNGACNRPEYCDEYKIQLEEREDD